LEAADTLSCVDGRSQVAGLGAWAVRDDDNTSVPTEVLYNTYWVRFPNREVAFDQATRLSEWLDEHAGDVGRVDASELARHYR
jgi:hypothetical protein